MADQQAVPTDPISAIAQALGELYKGIGNVWTSYLQKKIAKQQGENLAKMTEQERLRYYQAIQDGNTELASKMLEEIQSRRDKEKVTTWIIIGATFLIVMIIVYSKTKRK